MTRNAPAPREGRQGLQHRLRAAADQVAWRCALFEELRDEATEAKAAVVAGQVDRGAGGAWRLRATGWPASVAAGRPWSSSRGSEGGKGGPRGGSRGPGRRSGRNRPGPILAASSGLWQRMQEVWRASRGLAATGTEGW